MSNKKIKLFTLGYADNTSTSYILNYFIHHNIHIDGVILCRSRFKRNWKRFCKKTKMRGLWPSLKRVIENLLIRRRQISQLYQKHITNVFMVETINSEKVRDILISNQVELLLLTSTPIIKPIILDIEGLTILNAHTGMLPKYRGLDANLKAMRDESQLGVSIHRVTKKIDAGEVYLRKEFEISPKGDILKQMDEKELDLSAELLVNAVELMSKNKLGPIAQNEPLGIYEPPLSKNERNKIIKEVKRKLNI